ncbi:hypothetical protein H5410_047232, partial [Solanum commersonii]
ESKLLAVAEKRDSVVLHPSKKKMGHSQTGRKRIIRTLVRPSLYSQVAEHPSPYSQVAERLSLYPLIMKEAIRMVLKSIYNLEFPDTSHFCMGQGFHSVLRRIKEEWGTSRRFLEFDIRKCFHTIDRHRLM